MYQLAHESIYIFKLLLLSVFTTNIFLLLKNKNKIYDFFKKRYLIGFSILSIFNITYLNIPWYKYDASLKFVFLLLLVINFQVLFDLTGSFEKEKINKIVDDLSKLKN